MSKTILVTGGSGFVGSHLIEELLKIQGVRVISLDDYSSGKEENHLPGAEYVHGHTKDISFLIKERIDLVYHLGEYSRVEASFQNIGKVLDSNVRGTLEVFEFCRTNNTKIVYAGSSTKFGDGGMSRDSSPYAWSKAANSELIKNYGEWFGLPYAITYFYNVYGGREIRTGPYATVIGIFKEKTIRGEALSVVSPGTQKRNFTHVDDIVRGLIAVGESGLGDGYGLGCLDSFSMLEVAEFFKQPVEMLPERRGNRMSSVIDTSKVEKEFKWRAETHIRNHINEFLVSLS